MNTLTKEGFAEILLQTARAHHAFVQSLDEKQRDVENECWHEWYAEHLIKKYHLECSTIPGHDEQKFPVYSEASWPEDFYGSDPTQKENQ